MNRGSLVPSEILVCIPEEDAFRVAHLSYSNVRVVKTSSRGQVAQRTTGFEQAQQPMVLQLDDDIYLQEDALQALAEALRRLGHGNAVAPVYYYAEKNCCSHELSDGIYGWLESFFIYVVCGAPWGIKRMGVMTEIGTNYGVDSRHCDSNPFETQWLPGGCVLCFREDLIHDNFFPYTGKTYCEDLIHSFLRTRGGMRHWVIPSVKCLIDVPESEVSASSILAQIKAQRYFVTLSGGPVWRLTLYETFRRAKRVLSKKSGCMKS